MNINFKEIKDKFPIFLSIIAFLFFTHNYFKLSQWGTDWMTQLLDYDLLKNHLWQSVLYDFYQPPLVNIPIGLLIKIAPNKYTYLIAGAHYLLIIGTLVMLFQIFRKLTLSRNFSLILCSFFLINPSLWYTARISYYQMPVIFLFTAFLYLVIYYLNEKRLWYLIGIYLVMAILINIRTAITPFLFFATLLLFLIVDFDNLKRHIVVALCILPLIAFPYFKNYFIYGKFNRTLIGGVNFRALGDFTSASVKNDLYNNGKITRVFQMGPWQYPLTNYKPFLKDTILPAKFKEIPVLNKIESNQFNNYRHYFILEIVERLQSETWETVKRDPSAIFKMALFGNFIFFQPPSDYGMNLGNIQKTASWNQFYNKYLQGQWLTASTENIPIQMVVTPSGENTWDETWNSIHFEKTSILIVILYVVSFVLIGLNLIQFLQKRTIENTFVVFLSILFIYTYILYSSYGLYEGNRLRAEMLSMEIILIGIIGMKIRNLFPSNN